MAKDRIMILGAGVYQAPLIRKAAKMGLETVVVSPRGMYPGIPLADIYLDLDTTDETGVFHAAKKYAVSGIATTGTDVCLPALGKVTDGLGLAGPGHDAARRSMDKSMMKQALSEHGVPAAEFGVFTSHEEAGAFAGAMGGPVMVKAADSSGSRGISRVDDPSGFRKAWEHARASARSGRVIVERFLSGIEFGAQAFVHGGRNGESRVAAVFPHGDTVTPGPFLTPVGHCMPSPLTKTQEQETARVIQQAVHALGIADCVANVDLMLVDGAPVIIEIGARMGATCIPEVLFVYTGIDAYEHVIRLALGEYPEIRETGKQPNACLLLRSPATGTVKDILIPDSVKGHPSVVEIQIDVKPGDAVKTFEVGPDRIGHLVVKAQTAAAAESLADELASKIHFTISP